MKRVKVIGKFVKAKFMGATDEQATLAVLVVTFILITLTVA